MSDELTSWLETEAKLSGAKLSKVLQLFEDNYCESLADLKEQFVNGDLAETIPQTVIRKKIEYALGQQLETAPKARKAVPKADRLTISSSSAAIRQTEQQTQPQSSTTKNADQTALPPNKLYHFFASHKVRSVFELCVFWLVCM